MRTPIAPLLMAFTLCGCMTRYPASTLVHPATPMPQRYKPISNAEAEALRDIRHTKRRTFIGADYNTGAGTEPNEYFNLVRSHVAFASMTTDSASTWRSAFGFTAFGGTYTAYRWGEEFRPGSEMYPHTIYGTGAYADFNIGILGGPTVMGVGGTLMAALEGGEYADLWDKQREWPFFFTFQAGAYLFMDSHISEDAGLWIRAGGALPVQLFFDGGFTWQRLGFSIGGGYLYRTRSVYDLEKLARYTAGISYRL